MLRWHAQESQVLESGVKLEYDTWEFVEEVCNHWPWHPASGARILAA
jgi:hypothetical protein